MTKSRIIRANANTVITGKKHTIAVIDDLVEARDAFDAAPVPTKGRFVYDKDGRFMGRTPE